MYKTSTERRFHELSYQFFRVCHGRCYRVHSQKMDWQALSRDKIKKVAVLQYSDLFWCGRGDSPSRALKTVHRTVFARRDVSGGHRLFESSLCRIPHSFIQNKKSSIHKDAALGAAGGDSNLWPLESENCDIWQIAMNHRRDLCSVHKFLHWLLRKEKDVGT